MALTHICTQPVSDCETIDSTPEEALLNAQNAFPDAFTHHTTSEAIDHLSLCLTETSSRRVMILGHGRPGLIITGTGERATDQDSRIGLDNDSISVWPFELFRLNGQIKELTLCACETGADENGATLLARVANEIDAKASGFTGIIYIDNSGNISCEKGGQWQHALPGIIPDPIPHPEYPIEGDMESLRLKDNGAFKNFPISNVFEVRYFEPDQRGLNKRGPGKEKPDRQEPDKREWTPRFSLQGDQAQQLVRTVNFAKPDQRKGLPLAVLTARLDLRVKTDKGTSTWSFIVYNDRLLQDQSARDTYYFASPNFIKAVSERLK